METALSDIPLLSVMTFFPLLGALCIFFIAKFTRLKTDASKVIALTVSFVTFLLALAVFFVFDNTNPAFQLVERASWLPSFNAEYIRGIDGISLWFVMITAIITPIAILNSFGSIKKNIHEFMIAVLILETMMIGTFTSLDLVLFYVFFEGVLIPMFLIIGIWGGEKRIYATYKFFLYTLLGSLLMLVAVLYIAVAFNTTDMMQLIEQGVPIDAAIWIWLAFFASFAVKTPM
ncbi:MAG: NADH-quinone oxidoreductase subunit M, partial [Alphaproteobacteria bacterium]|nr:NADH-quinone oxidoreductase subunit M [Alphaproteobacteria bacterium]